MEMKLSVIVPVLNAKDSLPRLLDSILAQSERDLEIICIDEGSDDGSVDVIRDYAESSQDRVRLLEVNTDGGAATGIAGNTALNEGIRRAQGDYVHLVNVEDEIFPYAYEVVLTKIIANDLDCLRFRGYLRDPADDSVRDMPGFAMDDIADGMFMRLFDRSDESPRYSPVPDRSLLFIRRDFLLDNDIFFDEGSSDAEEVFIEKVVSTADRFSACSDRVILCGGRLKYAGTKLKQANIFSEAPSKPKVSVIVPVYNQEEYLNHALDTLRTQSLRQMEIVAVNDGSTDLSVAILREYAAIDARIRIIDKENTGYGHSMNLGIDAAKGEFIGILEPDDFVPSIMYEDMYLAGVAYDAQMVRADYYWIWENEDGTYRRRYKRLTSDAGLYNRVINPRKEPIVFDVVTHTWTGVYRRSFLNKHALRHHESPGASYQDNGFFFTCMSKTTRLLMLDRPYYCYRKDNPNASVADTTDKKLYCITDEYRWIKEWMDKNPDTARFESQYQILKLRHFLLSYKRATEASRLKYLMHLKDEFEQPFSDGVLNPDNLNDGRYKNLAEIIKNPEEYCRKVRTTVCMTFCDDSERVEDFVTDTLSRDVMRTELLCIDLGSKDGTGDILRRMAQSDDRIKVIDGAYSDEAQGFNAAIAMARGEYIVPVSMEFDYEFDYISSLVSKAYSKDADVCIANGRGSESSGLVSYEGAGYAKEYGFLPSDEAFACSDIERDAIRSVGLCLYDKAFSLEFLRKNDLKMKSGVKYFAQDFAAGAIKKAAIITPLHAKRFTYPDVVESMLEPEEYLDAMYEAFAVADGDEALKKSFANYALYRIGMGLLMCEGDFAGLYERVRSRKLAEYGIDRLGEADIADASLVEVRRNISECSAFEYLDHIRGDYLKATIALRNGARTLENARVNQKRLRGRLYEARKAEKKSDELRRQIEAMENSRSWKMTEPLRNLSKKNK